MAKLSNTYLCRDCNEVIDGPGPCPSCASEYTDPLAHWVRPLETRDVKPFIFPDLNKDDIFDEDFIRQTFEESARELQRQRRGI